MEDRLREDGSVELRLSAQEALVLSDLLYRLDEDDRRRVFLEDQAERDILWMLEGALESQCPEILSPSYADDLECARGAVRRGSDADGVGWFDELGRPAGSEEFESPRAFHLWHATASHHCVLLRAPGDQQETVTIDLRFFGVQRVNLPTLVRGLRIRSTVVDDSSRRFELLTEGQRFEIVAAAMTVADHDGDPFDPVEW